MLNTQGIQSRSTMRAGLAAFVSAACSASLDNLRIHCMPYRYRFEWRIDKCES
ncbi:MAG: hypothetical protein ACREVT_08815 [Burkholderiales bacterium]